MSRYFADRTFARTTAFLRAGVFALVAVAVVNVVGPEQALAQLTASTQPASDMAQVPRRQPRPSSGVVPIFNVDPSKSAAAVAVPNGRTLLGPISSFAYHIRDVDIDAVRNCRADVAVIDYSADGSHGKAFTRAQVDSMRLKPDGRRMKLIAYMSIGEAEEYRDLYFRRAWLNTGQRPAWLGPLNPKWPGNFNVRYWQPDWQKKIFGTPDSYLDILIANGFDGAYLDIVDGFEF